MTGKQAGCVNPEMPESIDFDELCDYLDRIKEAVLIGQKNTALEKPSQRRPAPIIVVVEGFLLFYDKKVCERLHVHLWVNGDRKTCLERQIVKNILAGAETGLDVASIENVFSEKAWKNSHYIASHSEQMSQLHWSLIAVLLQKQSYWM